jgi:hypothetical protein
MGSRVSRGCRKLMRPLPVHRSSMRTDRGSQTPDGRALRQPATNGREEPTVRTALTVAIPLAIIILVSYSSSV